MLVSGHAPSCSCGARVSASITCTAVQLHRIGISISVEYNQIADTVVAQDSIPNWKNSPSLAETCCHIGAVMSAYPRSNYRLPTHLYVDPCHGAQPLVEEVRTAEPHRSQQTPLTAFALSHDLFFANQMHTRRPRHVQMIERRGSNIECSVQALSTRRACMDNEDCTCINKHNAGKKRWDRDP